MVWAVIVLAVAAIWPIQFALSESHQGFPIPRAPAFSPKQLTILPRGDWITNGGNALNQRYARLAQINVRNAGQLRLAWHRRLSSARQAGKYSAEATPLVYRGIMYLVTGNDDVFALDARTGQIRWNHRSGLFAGISTVCCGWSSRGVALGDGKVYVARLDGNLEALNQDTGRRVWIRRVGDWRDGYTMTLAPLFYDGLVIVGVSGGDIGIRGFIAAYDASTGERVWRFWTIPAPGQFGHKTWPATDSWKTGGGPVFNTPSVDSNLGLIYFVVGNPAPSNGHFRAGNNLFTVSVVALDVRTGKYRWHFQVIHHDIWDQECATPTLLFDLVRNGKLAKGLAAFCKTGWTYILDRRTGRPLLPIVERKVEQNGYQRTSRTQPIPLGDAFVPQCANRRDFAGQRYRGKPFKVGCVFTPYDTRQFVSIKPSSLGGSNWPPSSYSPKTGYVYVCAVDRPTALRALPIPAVPPPGQFYTGVTGTLGRSDQIRGTFTAIDTRTNRIVWQRKWPEQMCYSGSLATAGGLVFVGRGDRGLVAYDARRGEMLWRFRTLPGANAPPIAYTTGNKEYVAIYAGGNIQGGPHTPVGSDVYAFTLKT